MKGQVSRQQFISGTAWKIAETMFSVGTTFVVSLVLMRLLSPNDFGVIALTTLIINFSEIILQSAFTTPLIQKTKVDDTDYTTVLFLSFVIAFVLYVLVYFTSPSISSYFNEIHLTKVLRVLCLIFFIQAFGSVRIAMITRNMQFKILSFSNLAASLIAGFTGIAMAYIGFGIWSLVAQKLLQQLLLTIILFLKLHWKPQRGIQLSRLKEMWGFGLRVLGSSLLSFFGDSATSAVTGKIYSVTTLGYLNSGTQYSCQMSIYSFNAITTALFPTLSSYKDNVDMMKSIVRRVVAVSSYILFPMMAGIFAVSRGLTIFLLTEKWLPSVPFMQWSCLYYCATPLMLINIQVFHALRRGEVRLYTEIVRTSLIFALLLAAMGDFGLKMQTLYAIKACIEVLITLITVYKLKSIITYSVKEYINDIIKPFILSLFMIAVVVNIGNFIHVNTTVLLFIQTSVGAGVYAGLSILCKPQGYRELLMILKGFIGKTNQLALDKFDK